MKFTSRYFYFVIIILEPLEKGRLSLQNKPKILIAQEIVTEEDL